MSRIFHLKKRSSGITSAAFAGTIAVLIVIAGIGFGLYGTSLASPSRMFATMSSSSSH